MCSLLLSQKCFQISLMILFFLLVSYLSFILLQKNPKELFGQPNKCVSVQYLGYVPRICFLVVFFGWLFCFLIKFYCWKTYSIRFQSSEVNWDLHYDLADRSIFVNISHTLREHVYFAGNPAWIQVCYLLAMWIKQ